MKEKRGVLRFGVLCLLITLACACKCNEEDRKVLDNILFFEGELTTCINYFVYCSNEKCGNPEYKKLACDFIVEHTKIISRCNDDKFVSKEAATMCSECWSERENPLPKPPPNPPPTTPPRTPPQTPLKNPEHKISSWNVSDILWDAVFDNFVAHAISSVFKWIEECLMWAWNLLLKYVLPVALSTLSIAFFIAKYFCAPLQLISDKLHIIVMVGWFTFALYYLWLFGSYQFFDDRLFILCWALSCTNVVQASNGNRTQIDNKTQNIFNGPTLILHDQTGSVLHQILPQFFGGRAQPEPLIAGQSPMKELPPSQDSEASYVTPIDNPSVPAARSRSSHSSSSSQHKVPAPPAARGNTKPATEASVKKECVNPAPRAAAATAASPGFISQTWNKLVQVIAVKREKRNRNDDGEQTAGEPPRKKFCEPPRKKFCEPPRKKFCEMTVAELREELKKGGIHIPSRTLKEGLVQLAETNLTRA
jgi:hypothetical protein